MKKIVTLLLVIVLLVSAAGCGRASGQETPAPEPTPAPTPTPTPAPHEPTIALVIANQQFNYEEYADCRVLFILDGYEVITAGQRTGAALSMDGQETEIDTQIGSLEAHALDALVVIGGSGAPALYGDTALQGLIQDMYAAGKPVAAICLAPVTLAEAGLLTGKQATVYPDESALAALSDAGALYMEDQDVVIDGTIVTASGPEAAKDFAVTVLSLMGDTGTAPVS